MGLAVVEETFERDWEETPRQREYREPRYAQKPQAAPQIVFPTEQVIAVLSAIAAIIGARLALLLAGLAAWSLAYQATNGGSVWPLVVFGALVFIPLVYLSASRKI